VTPAEGERESRALRVVVLADDLIWATRLVGQLRTVGADPVRVGSADAFAAALAVAPPGEDGGTGAIAARPGHAVVDLTARSYEGLDAVRTAVAAGVRVLCVGQHDDYAERRAARAAGAERVLAYRKLFENGHAILAAWLGVPGPAVGSLGMPASHELAAR
jgi:hypothetical protein